MALADETYEYAIIGGLGLCRVEDFKTEDANDDWCTLSKNEDGSYDFRASYYNGGAHWIEVVEVAVKRSEEILARGKQRASQCTDTTSQCTDTTLCERHYREYAAAVWCGAN